MDGSSAQTPERRMPQITLTGLLLLIAMVGLGSALLVTVIRAARESAVRTACSNNLSTLYKATYLYCSSFGRKQDYMPHTGQPFLLCLDRCADPAHPATYAARSPCSGNTKVFLCPATGHASGIDYLGPRKHTPPGNPSALSNEVPAHTVFACDKPGNHPGGGHVVRMDGAVFIKEPWTEGADYDAALKQTE
jgi:hypothetical protein